MKHTPMIWRLASCVLTVALLLSCVGGVSATGTQSEPVELYRFTPNGVTAATDAGQIKTNHVYLNDSVTSCLKATKMTKYTQDGPVTVPAIGFVDRVATSSGDYFGLPYDETLPKGSKATENLKLEFVKTGTISTTGYDAVNVWFEYAYVPGDSPRNVAYDELLQVYVSTDGTNYLPGTAGIRWSELTGVGKTAADADALFYSIQTENLLDIAGVAEAGEIKKIMIMPDGDDSRVQAGQVIMTGLTVNGYGDAADFEARYPLQTTKTVDGDTLRTIVLEEAARTAELEWTTEADIDTGDAGDIYHKEVLWNGPVYDKDNIAFRETIEAKLVDGVYTGGTMGMDCQSFVFNAISRVSRTNGNGVSYYPGASGMRWIDGLKTGGRVFLTDTDVIDWNTPDEMFAAYAKLQPGDIVYTYTADSVHVRLVVSVDGANKTVTCTEQGSSVYYDLNNCKNYSNPLHAKDYATLLSHQQGCGCTIDKGFSALTAKKYSFQELYDAAYAPATLTVYDDGVVEEVDSGIVIVPLNGADYTGGAAIGIASNYPINRYDVKLTDLADDAVVFEGGDFSGHIRTNAMAVPNTALNEALAGLSNGDYRLAVTVTSGPVTQSGAALPTTTEYVDFTVANGHTHSCGHAGHTVTGEWIPLSTKTSGMTASIGLPAGNYYLDEDIELVGGYISLAGNTNLCLNGHSITGADSKAYIFHFADSSASANDGAGAILNICDCSAAQTGTIGNWSTSTESTGSTYGAIIARKNGDVNIYSGKFTGISAYNIIYVAGGSTVTMYGGEISGNSTNNGVSLASGGAFVMEGGVIANNTTQYNGAVHVASGGTFTMNDGVIAGNTVTSGKAPVTGTYTQNGGTITEDAYSAHFHTCTHGHDDFGTDWMPLSPLVEAGPETGNDYIVIPSGNYYLDKDITIESSAFLNLDDAEVNLCLNGNNLAGAKGFAWIFRVGKDNAATLNICDCSGDQSGTLGQGWAGKNAASTDAIMIIRKGSTVNLWSGTLTGTAVGSAVYIASSTFNMHGGKITRTVNNYNGAVHVASGTFNMTGGEISNNTVPAGKTQVTGTYTNNGGTIIENGADESLKVLSIGNSYSADSLNYLPQIAESYGEDVTVGFLVQASGSLSDHVSNIQNSASPYIWYTYVNGVWTKETGKSLYHGLTAMDWDVIVLQQRSLTSGVADSYNEDLATLVDYVNANKTNPDAKLWWHMTWAYANGYSNADFVSYYEQDSDRMYESIVNAVNEKIVPDLGQDKTFEVLIPTGTTIQNARTADPDRTFSRDGTHLNTLGRIMASYTWYAKLFGVEQLDELAVTSVAQSFDEKVEAYTMTAADQTLVLDAVNGALSKPFGDTDGSDWTGLKVSVLGDSISTYEGYSNSPAYNTTLSDNLIFFPKAGAGFDVNGTWWMQVIENAGMELLVNNSFSGDELNPEQSPGKGLERVTQLHDSNGTKPDVIFVYFGTNDAGNEDETDVFRGHYTTMMESIAQTYPDAEVFYFTLLPRYNRDVTPYNTVIRDLVSAAEDEKVHLVDLYEDSGITPDNLQQVTIDNLHPNYKGMDLISNAVLDVMGLEPLAADPVTTPAHTHTCTHDHVDENVVWQSLNDVAAEADGSNFAIPNGHFYLEENLTLTGTQQILVQGARDTTICLNGYDIVAGGSASYIFYYGANDYTPKCTLNICDCSGTGKIRGLNGGTAFYHGAFSVNKGGTLNLYGGTVTGNKTSNTVCVLGEATFNMYGGAITGNETTLNGAVYVSGGAFNMYGGEISGNTVPSGKTQVTGTYTNNGGTVTDGSSTATHTHACNDHEGITDWVPLSTVLKEKAATTLEGGHYYLDKDIILGESAGAAGTYYLDFTTADSVLCLNGYTLDGQYCKNNIFRASGVNVDICDCSEARTGTITGINTSGNSSYSVGIARSTTGTINVYGGSITGNTAPSLFYVAAGCALNVYGGNIEQGDSSWFFSRANSSTSKVTLSGGKYGKDIPTTSLTNFVADGCVLVELEDEVYGWVVVPELITGATVENGESVDLKVAVDVSELEGEHANYTVVMNKQGVTDSATATVTGTLDELLTYDEVTLSYYLTFPDVAAKEMGDRITVTVTDDADEVVMAHVFSAADQFKSILANTDDQNVINLCVDALNYGAAAQERFGYNTGALVNADLDTESTTVTGTWIDGLSVTESYEDKYAATATLKEKLELNMYFDVDCSQSVPAVTVTGAAKYTANAITNGVSTILRVTIQEILPKDAKNTVTVTVEADEGTIEVTDSLAGYIVRSSSDRDQAVLEALKRYIDSAIALSEQAG